jgi:uncharacterized paraquat-inducible protein A
MTLQSCPNCRSRNDVAVYVHGQETRCPKCGLRFFVDRENEAPRRTPTPAPPAAALMQILALAQPPAAAHPAHGAGNPFLHNPIKVLKRKLSVVDAALVVCNEQSGATKTTEPVVHVLSDDDSDVISDSD